MQTVPGHTHLYRSKGGTYHYVRRVPTHLIVLFEGRRLIKKTLRTRDLRQAKARLVEMNASVQDRINEADAGLIDQRAELVPITALVEEDLRAMVGRWLHDIEHRAAAAHAKPVKADPEPGDIEDPDLILAELREEEAAISHGWEEPSVQRVARQILEGEKVELVYGTPQFAAFSELVERAMIENVRRERDRVRGLRTTRVHDAHFASVSSDMAPPPRAVKAAAVSFGKLLELWEAENDPRPRTKREWKRFIGRLCEYLGHRDAARVQKRDLAAWKHALRGAGVGPKTVDNHLAAVRAVYSTAIRNDLLQANPASDLGTLGKKKVSSDRQSYTDAQAKMLLEGARKFKGFRRWVPWLLAYTGARMEEVCQPLASDIREEEPGLWVLDINDEGDKTLKNPSSARKVPLHRALIDEGFLDYWKKLPKDGRLFPDITRDSTGKWGGNVSKWYGRWQRKTMGIGDRRLVAHSWRHRFKTLCRAIEMDSEARAVLSGHAPRNEGERYGEYPLPALAKALYSMPDQTKTRAAQAGDPGADEIMTSSDSRSGSGLADQETRFTR